ncbi:hypothetical protein [Streptosporangium lutulentum]|uniref:DUF222 domain-containing protein n=1 Tax=Streptosporangium lutulentum TaxID=1461250 RepID=A0ABT9QTZ7_9ACTN|nr:hypothetical protein [Streptosporangium lutulentum]MDP9850247.1 hypothetical protein [Streptosporangium lutulentum]
MAGTVAVMARVAHGTRKRLTARMEAERARRSALLTAARAEIGPHLAALERAERRAALTRRLAELREHGELADTVDVLLTHAVRGEMAARAWDVDWPPVPAGAPRAGRWPGSRDGGWPEKIVARIPAELEAQVHAACWHTSKEAIAELRTWRDARPAPVFDVDALALYERLADQVTTPGEIWRAAVDRALLAPPAEIPLGP